MIYNILSTISIIFLVIFGFVTISSNTDKKFIIRFIVFIILLFLNGYFHVAYNNFTTSVTNPRIDEINAEYQAKIEYENSTQK